MRCWGMERLSSIWAS